MVEEYISVTGTCKTSTEDNVINLIVDENANHI